MGFFSELFGGKKEEVSTPRVQTEAPKAKEARAENKICTNCGAINSNGEGSCKDCASPL